MLTENETQKLRQAIIATIASPLIGSIEDYTWEAMFHYVKDINLSDPALGRSKLLYDAVDFATSTGWSLKSLQLNNLTSVNTFSFVIQRADIIKKATQLGFPSLTELSSPTDLGNEYIYCEFPLNPFDPSTFSWNWTTDKNTGQSGAGLQGSVGGKTELVWYKNQKQLFRTRTLPPEAVYIKVERNRLTPDRYVNSILSALQDQFREKL